MRVLVTGGAGFIGSHVVDAYLDAGHEVTVVDDLSSGRRENVDKRARFEKTDIRAGGLELLFAELRPEVLSHHAAQMDVRRSVADPRFDAEVNIIGLINLLECARKHGTRRVIFASSGGAAYGDTDRLPTPETHELQPASPYGVAKASSELYLSCYRQMYGLDFVALRYANVYGPRQSPHGEAGVVAIFATRCLKRQPRTINGDGKQTRDYVFVGDVARANVSALEAPCGRYNIGTGVETDVNALDALIAKAAGETTPPLRGPAKVGEQQRSCLDASLAAKTLNWKPEVPLAAGIAGTVAWFSKSLPLP